MQVALLLVLHGRLGRKSYGSLVALVLSWIRESIGIIVCKLGTLLSFPSSELAEIQKSTVLEVQRFSRLSHTSRHCEANLVGMGTESVDSKSSRRRVRDGCPLLLLQVPVPVFLGSITMVVAILLVFLSVYHLIAAPFVLLSRRSIFLSRPHVEVLLHWTSG